MIRRPSTTLNLHFFSPSLSNFSAWAGLPEQGSQQLKTQTITLRCLCQTYYCEMVELLKNVTRTVFFAKISNIRFKLVN